jgi:3',5'-cyclic AMP phosphodiesterase CpdA
MRRIVHISDLHFGRVETGVLPRLHRAIVGLAPDVLVVSGDLTQRARAEEFRQARIFLDCLPEPQVVVPGNHDVPLYNVLRRWLAPLAGYKRHITEDLAPFYADHEIAVLGINTARSLTIKDGRINSRQVEAACSRFATQPQEALRIVATHHPFAAAEESGRDLVGRSEMAIAAFARCGVDVILSGHTHASHSALGAERYRVEGRSALLIQAGTATSSRRRGEANAFNLLRIEGDRLELERFSFRDGAFSPDGTERYVRGPAGWSTGA